MLSTVSVFHMVLKSHISYPSSRPSPSVSFEVISKEFPPSSESPFSVFSNVTMFETFTVPSEYNTAALMSMHSSTLDAFISASSEMSVPLYFALNFNALSFLVNILYPVTATPSLSLLSSSMEVIMLLLCLSYSAFMFMEASYGSKSLYVK